MTDMAKKVITEAIMGSNLPRLHRRKEQHHPWSEPRRANKNNLGKYLETIDGGGGGGGGDKRYDVEWQPPLFALKNRAVMISGGWDGKTRNRSSPKNEFSGGRVLYEAPTRVQPYIHSPPSPRSNYLIPREW